MPYSFDTYLYPAPGQVEEVHAILDERVRLGSSRDARPSQIRVRVPA